MSLPVRDVVACLEEKGGTYGLSRKTLEAKAWVLEKSKDWGAFNIVLDLLIYGVVLLENIDDFIDFPSSTFSYPRIWSQPFLAYILLPLCQIREEKKDHYVFCTTTLHLANITYA